MAAANVVGPPRTQQQNRVFQIMARHPEVCCLIVAFILFSFSRHTRSVQKTIVVGQPPPEGFFVSHAPVIDFPYGDIEHVSALLLEEEVLFVMFYAPWCAKSKQVRVEFERAAYYMKNEVKFVGVNCWWFRGGCRQRYPFVAFPVLFFYHTNLNGFRFDGPFKAEHMVHFVQQLLYPLVPIHTETSLGLFIAKSDTSVIGFFDFHRSPQPPGFIQFYFASMRVIENDSRNIVEFGIVSNRSLIFNYDADAEEHTVFLTSACNETKRYPPLRNFTSSAIAKWVIGKAHACSAKWFIPQEMKSLRLSSEIDKGPALILFTPDYPLAGVNQHFNMLREVVLDYFNCKNSTRVHGLIESSQFVRWRSLLTQLDDVETCNQRIQSSPQSDVDRESEEVPCCISVPLLLRPTDACDVCMHRYDHNLSNSRHICNFLNDVPLSLLHSYKCTEILLNYDSVLSLCCDKNNSPKHHQRASSWTVNKDPYMQDCAINSRRDMCRKLRLQKMSRWQSQPTLAELSFGEPSHSLAGLGCRTNKSLNIFVLDSREAYPFADSLDINLGAASNKTVSVIIDKKNEVQYVMRGSFNKTNLVNFITNYTDGSLPRHLRSPATSSETYKYEETESLVPELNTSTFLNTILQEDKDVLVLYYAPWCGFCAAFSHVYLRLSRYFRAAKNIVFARINSDLHDLPWEYSVDAYPTIILFPAYRKVESIPFPEYLPKTLPHLVQFVLRHAGQTLRIETGLSICKRSCIDFNRRNTARQVRHLVNEINRMKSSIDFIEDKIDEYHHVTSTRNINIELPNGFRLADMDIMVKYVSLLRTRSSVYDLRLRCARQLYSILLGIRGPFIEQHRLMSILNDYRVRLSQLNTSQHQHQHQRQDGVGVPEVGVNTVLHDEL